MNIITNNKPRDIVRGYELTAKEAAEFDYLAPDDLATAEFIKYRGEVYLLADFVRIAPRARAVGFEHGADDSSPLLSWSGILTDSYFSGLVLRFADDNGRPDFERVIVGRVYS